MRKFKGWVATNKVGSKVEFEFEVDDESDQHEIEETFEQGVWDNIGCDFKEIIDKE